jgi:hypothetical protein
MKKDISFPPSMQSGITALRRNRNKEQDRASSFFLLERGAREKVFTAAAPLVHLPSR